MARPKVHPENRLRANTACTACRKSKKRCSGVFPCSNCLHKGRGGSCIPFRSLPGLRSRTASRPAAPTWSESGIDLESPVRPQTHEETTPDPGVASPEAEPHSPEAPHRTHPRMLRNLQGDRVYVGKAASLSFLQLLRDTVTQHIGPSQFSQRSEDMLETEAHHDLLNFSIERCNVDEKRHFIQSYEAATSGFLNLACKDNILTSSSSSGDPKSDREKTRTAIVDLMVAIGAQTQANNPETLQAERFYAARGQQRAFANFLEDPSMDVVRIFILLSFYMLGACRRNAAFMYLGVASRAAVALGLHEHTSGSTSRDDNDQRPKLWMSLCVLDLLVSAILGRPSATSPLLSGHREEPMLVEATQTESGLAASYHLSLILDEIVTSLYGEKTASAETADLLLRKLNSWSECLPYSLRTSSLGRESERIAQRHTLGNMHVACSYHFAVILVTRPFLISALSVRLAQTHQNLSANGSRDPPDEDPAHSRLAAACIDSAVYMLQTCIEVYDSGLMLRNMCILKAFIFAAALVIGFSMFAHRDIDTEIDEAFRGAMTILRMLASQSAQAAHYLDITIMLEAAVNQQRQRLAAQARQRRSQYVSRIFSLSDDPEIPRRQSEVHEQAGDTPLLTQSIPSYSWLQSDDGISTVTPPAIDGALFDWEGMDLPLWDSFPFLTESAAI
ncbi:unnamed protein product [Penicillium olsonii]|uniref:Zn(2)-C6 fungal-type domain-containing protein n=1 Tax=Penicillium olsonii TaxID=99116 RepID=A0A9W4HJV3_PENOL|nr:unnamed protein product [Penicillium olsonii]CAG8049075.1 unnamed protein product [Penicillium olsonii]